MVGMVAVEVILAILTGGASGAKSAVTAGAKVTWTPVSCRNTRRGQGG